MSRLEWKWQDYYLEAFLETNPQNLMERVTAAENAIFLRTKEMGSGSETKAEWQAIADAMAGLSILKREIKSHVGAERGPVRSEMSAGRGPSGTMDGNHLSRAGKN